MAEGAPEEGFDNFYSICGFLGGVVFAISLLPQLWKTFWTKSTEDLSYMWQGFYLLGLACIGVYCIAYNLWPILGPGIADFTFMALLIGMKFYFENIYRGPKPAVTEVDLEEQDAKDQVPEGGEMRIDKDGIAPTEAAILDEAEKPLQGVSSQTEEETTESEKVLVEESTDENVQTVALKKDEG